MRRANPVVPSLVLGLAVVAGPAYAGESPATGVGLSSVRAQRFENEDLLVFLPEAQDRFAEALVAGDFDGDGVDDLATGMPFDDGLAGSGCTNCGAVVVRYGVAGSGLDGGLADDFLSQQAGGSPSPAGPNDQFGAALAAADFNGDGIDDLAVGIPGETGAQGFRSGGVAVHYGLPGGVQLVAEHLLLPGVDGVPGFFQEPLFGRALAAGDFDDDSFDDLAIGAPARSGSVTVLHGGVGGLMPASGYLVNQDQAGIPDEAEEEDEFGTALASGDLDGDGFDELVIGVPGEDLDVGAFLTLFGSEFGLLFQDHRWLGQGPFPDTGGPEAGDRFGQALACGDFDGDGHDDVAIGAPFEDVGTVVDAGAFTVVHGDAQLGLDLGHSYTFDQFVDSEPTDVFGFALATGDFDGDGTDDLAVGHHGEETPGGGIDGGAVTVVMGVGFGVGLQAPQRTLVQGREGFPGPGHQPGARFFGFALATGDYDGDGHADLAAGAPHEDVDGLPNVGVEMVLYGSLFADGFETADSSFWSTFVP